MQIDWFTFGAQIVNFLLLVWLLKRFLYGPITRAMSEREERIAERFEDAREQQERAEKEAAEYRQKIEELEAVREEKLGEAEEAARERRRELIEEARQEVERLERQWKAALGREEETFLTELTERASRETLLLARRALQDLAHAELESQVVQVFLERLRSLDEDRKTVLAEAIESDDGRATVRTAFQLGEADRRRVTETLQDVSGIEVSPDFEHDAEVGFGIEVRAEGQRVAWNLQSYFREVEERVRAQIEAELPRQMGSAAETSAGQRSDAVSTAHTSSDER